MRLLNVNTLRLEEFYGAIPQYAILSHRWGKEEVTFQDMTTLPDWEKKAGHIKISYSCQQAQEDDLEYVWIDSICIDKSSSAELSEAINSMYAWYEKADVCYAYLDDVLMISEEPQVKGVVKVNDFTNAQLSPDAEFEGRFNPYDKYHKFRASKWFTRGWTLQELLAPLKVTFFAARWVYLGTKETLATPISEATTIPESVIQVTDRPKGRRPSVAQRMSWAAGRETTRIEDKAYCLLGIFNVNMPLLYGEGSKSFIRLQEEILKNSADHSLLAWNPTSGLCGALAISPDQFRHCGKIIPFPSKAQIPRSYSMTNIGLNIELPLLPAPNGDTIALLDCQYEDDFSGRLGIQIRRTATPSVFRRMRTFKSIYTTHETACAKIRQIYIVKTTEEDRFSEEQQSEFCIVRSDSMKHHDYAISAVVCQDWWGLAKEECWNAETQVMNLPLNIRSAAIEFKSPERKQTLVAVLKLPRHADSKAVAVSRETGDADLNDWLLKCADHLDGNMGIPENLARKCPELDLELRREELLNQEVFVLDVRIHRKPVLHVDVVELE